MRPGRFVLFPVACGLVALCAAASGLRGGAAAQAGKKAPAPWEVPDHFEPVPIPVLAASPARLAYSISVKISLRRNGSP